MPDGSAQRQISDLAVTGDKGSVTVVKEGLWNAERGAGKAVSMPMPK